MEKEYKIPRITWTELTEAPGEDTYRVVVEMRGDFGNVEKVKDLINSELEAATSTMTGKVEGAVVDRIFILRKDN